MNKKENIERGKNSIELNNESITVSWQKWWKIGNDMNIDLRKYFHRKIAAFHYHASIKYNKCNK